MTEVTEPDILQVPVRGGELTVGRWGGGDQVVVAVHGITANHRSFDRFAEELGEEVTVLAPDLRGRGGSAELPGPWGMGTHADDVVAILDHLELDSATFLGHSMGGFVVTKTAERHPERVDRLVLMDGGIPLPIEWPEGLDTEAKIQAVIGPALDRLDRSWDSLEGYLEYWRPHPAVGETWNAYVEAYLTYDVHEVDGGWRSKVSREAIVFDGRETLEDESSVNAIERIDVPTTLLWAPRGIMNQQPGLYPPEEIARIEEAFDHLTCRQVEDVNHYSLAFSERGASVVAETVRKALVA